MSNKEEQKENIVYFIPFLIESRKRINFYISNKSENNVCRAEKHVSQYLVFSIASSKLYLLKWNEIKSRPINMDVSTSVKCILKQFVYGMSF